MIWLIASAMRSMMPRAHGLPGIADTDLIAFLHNLRRDADPLYWHGLLLGTFVFQLTPVLTLRLPVPAFVLPANLRETHATRIVSHQHYGLRQAVNLVRLSAGLCWGSDPKVRAHFALSPYPPDSGGFRTT